MNEQLCVAEVAEDTIVLRFGVVQRPFLLGEVSVFSVLKLFSVQELYRAKNLETCCFVVVYDLLQQCNSHSIPGTSCCQILVR